MFATQQGIVLLLASRMQRFNFLPMNSQFNYEQPWLAPSWCDLTQMILDSYEHWLEQPLMNRAADAQTEAMQIFHAPRVILAHNNAEDPVFTYANQIALVLWETDLKSLLGMPSRHSAEPVYRSQRGEMLGKGLEKGFITNYEGIRISRQGRRFHIRHATIWNLHRDGRFCGQAATFDTWEHL